MLNIVLIVTFIPLVLLASLGLQKQASRFQFALSSLALALALLFMWAALPWDVVSIYYRWLMPILFVFAMISGYRRIGTAQKQAPRWSRISSGIINVALITLFAGLCWRVFLGYPAPDHAIELSSPLKDGQFVVGHGGASPFINGHYKVKPQNYALDILGVNAWGARSNIMGDSSQLHNYAIYGKAIVAPCDGVVVVARDGLPDLPPGETDRENLAGNHVVIECQGVELVLAHMLSGSVFVEESSRVATGDFLGRVGNSGNTSEPHLHMHAEKDGEPGQILDGEAVPILIDGKFLVRGSLLP